jgi:hypothetical protein
MSPFDFAILALEWTGIAVGGVCTIIGALTLVNAWRIQMELWKAKRRWLYIERQKAGFIPHLHKEQDDAEQK